MDNLPDSKDACSEDYDGTTESDFSIVTVYDNTTPPDECDHPNQRDTVNYEGSVHAEQYEEGGQKAKVHVKKVSGCDCPALSSQNAENVVKLGIKNPSTWNRVKDSYISAENWNPDTTADGIALHCEDCELRNNDDEEEECQISPVNTSENGATADGESHPNGRVATSSSGHNDEHGFRLSNHPAPTTPLRDLPVINYCTLASIFVGLYYSFGSHEAREKFQELLCQSKSKAYKTLIKVFEKVKNDQIVEAVKCWIFEMYKDEEIRNKWLINGQLDFFDTEYNTVINKLLITLEDRQPLILFLRFTDWSYLIVKENDLPKTLQLNGARYKLAFCTKWKNGHFTAHIFNYDREQWEIYGVNLGLESIGPAKPSTSSYEYQSAIRILRNLLLPPIERNVLRFPVNVDRSTSEKQLEPNCFPAEVLISDGENQYEASIKVHLNYVDQSSMQQPNVGINISTKVFKDSIQVTGDQFIGTIPVQVTGDQSNAKIQVQVTSDDSEASILVQKPKSDGGDYLPAKIKLQPTELIITVAYVPIEN